MGDVRAGPDHRLAGRGAERDALAGVVAAAAQRRPSAMVVHGEAGVGKTRLVQEVCGDPELLVLWGSCVHFGGASVPYAPVIGVLQDWLVQADAAERAAVLTGADELSSLLPALGGLPSTPTARLIPLIDLVLNRIADRHRTVVVVDDLHWADLASLDVLAYVITGFRAQQLTVLGTSRDEDRGVGHPLHSWLADMRRMPSFHELHLDRLDLDTTGLQVEYLVGQIPDIALVNQVQARSDGNPYLTELLVQNLSGAESTLPDTVSGALRDALLAAWHRLSAQARQLVRVLAVGGRPTPLPILAAVAGAHGVEVGGLPGYIAEAQERGVIGGGHGPPWFRHPLLADVLYDGLPPGEAALIHTTYLEVLESRSDPVEPVAADLAVHSLQAGRIDDTYRWSEVAAGHAVMLRAPAEQAIQLERMCDLWEQVSPELRGTTADRTALILKTAAIGSRVARNDQAIELLTQAISLVDRARDPLPAADLLIDRSTVRWHRAESIEAVATDIHDAFEATSALPDSAQHARALAALAWAERWQGLPGAVAHADEAVRIARRAGSPRALAAALAQRSMVLSSQSPLESLADGQEAERLARSCGATLEWLRGVVWQRHALWNLGRREEATEAALRNYADMAAPGRDLFAYFLAYLAAEGLLESGRWQECDELLRAGLAVRCVNTGGAGLRLTAASLAVRRGRVAEARQHLDRAVELIPATFRGIRHSLATGGGEVLLAEHKPQAAIDWIGSRLTLLDAAPIDEDDDLLVLYAHAVAESARVARDAGDQESAAKAVGILEDTLSSRPGEPFTSTDSQDSAFKSMYRAQISAELARCRNDADQPERWLRAVDACGAAGARWHQAVARWRCAEAAIAGGQPPVGVANLLRQAHSCAVELGAAPLQAEVESLARRSRISLRAPVPVAVPEEPGTPLSTLTSREREILAFLVAGRSNGEIAKDLVITDKTVSAHVSNILRKTGTASRLEAAALAVRLNGPGA
ncbi:helix-turn-helix transcriptional regulator [Kribbella capetownensis]|uniref:helix-turn-helix transcriptional regulator n=1 Tax=Kribbella capetownensis TaxID=1572659 RepID=UPI0013F3DB5A|nr:LuxR family transcriptional regulator [Kribbella capetownensis]